MEVLGSKMRFALSVGRDECHLNDILSTLGLEWLIARIDFLQISRSNCIPQVPIPLYVMSVVDYEFS